MSLTQTLLQTDIWFALCLFMVAALILIPLAAYTETKLPAPLHWQWEHVAMPLLRILLLLLFIILAYPDLYGLQSAPSFSSVISSENGRSHQLINLLFILSVLLPFIPLIGEQQTLALPVQGVTAVALIFNWIPDKQTPLICYWPGMLTTLVLLGLAWFAFRLAMLLGQTISLWFDRRYHVTGSHEMISNTLLLILQSPLIVVYAHSLGSCMA